MHWQKLNLMKNGFAQLYLLIGLVVLALLGGAYYFGKLPVKSSIPQPQVSVSPSPKPTQIDETANWKIYNNSKYDFSFKYPLDWGVVYDEKYIIKLSNKNSDTALTIGVKNYTDKTNITRSGVGAGDIEKRGTIQFLGQPIEKNVLVFKGKDIVLLYDNGKEISRGNLIFTLSLENTTSYIMNLDSGPPQGVLPESENLSDQILSTFKFVNQSTGIPSSTITPSVQPKKLTYQLPAGWKTVQDTTGTFEVGYNPQVNQLSSTSVKSLAVSLAPIWQASPAKRLGPPADVALLPYNNGSRHQFILGSGSGWEKGKNYHEREYSYNGWSCLVLFDIYISQGPVTNGACAVSNNRAFSFGIDSYDETKAEQLISTLKLLK